MIYYMQIEQNMQRGTNYEKVIDYLFTNGAIFMWM